MSYDAWLEKPYQDMCAAEDRAAAYCDWLEEYSDEYAFLLTINEHNWRDRITQRLLELENTHVQDYPTHRGCDYED